MSSSAASAMTSMHWHRCTQPVVLQNLAPAESLHQAIDSLAHLMRNFDHVVGRVASRMEEEHQRVVGLKTRINKARGLIATVKSTKNRACTIHAQPRYMDKERPGLSKAINCGVDLRDTSTVDPVPLSRAEYRLTPGQRAERPAKVSTTDLFQRLSAAGHRRRRIGTAPDLINTNEGLGPLPDNIESVSSLLLFNTSENPYKSYTTLDNLEGEAGKDRVREQAGLAAAPQTIASGQARPRLQGQDLAFKPTLSGLADFNLPDQLPDLDSIATDVVWGAQQAEPIQIVSIAPSAEAMLPDFGLASTTAGMPTSAGVVAPSAAPTATGTPAPAVAPAIAPPVATAPTSAPPIAAPAIPVASTPAAPVPPPKPVVPASSAAPAAAAPAASSGGVRNGLMESIRLGMRLKNVKKGEGAKVKESKRAKKTKKPQNMMSDLRAALNARANVMAGGSKGGKKGKKSTADDEDSDDEWEESD